MTDLRREDLHIVDEDHDAFYEYLEEGAVDGMDHDEAERLIYKVCIPFKVVEEMWKKREDVAVDLDVRVIKEATFFREADSDD